MLTPEQFKEINKEASKIYSDLELEIIEEIAQRIANVGYANTVVVNDAKVAQEMGLLYQDIVQQVAEYNNASVEKVQSIFEDAGIKTLKFDDRIYKAVGLNPIPIKQSKTMLNLLLTSAEKTSTNLSNLVMTTAETSQTAFYNSMNKAYMEVSTGTKSYSTAILDTIKELSKKSATVKYPSEYETSIENAVRMNIVTGVNQTCGKLQMMRARELNWDLMELTAHSGARPEHADWQGKIVSLSGNKKYLTLDDIGYGKATGFKGVNCNHDWHPYYEGMSRVYSDEELEQMKNETVTYNGQEIKRYDAQQMQRKMERQIRQDKKDLAGLQGTIKGAKDNKLLEEAKTKFADKSLRYNTHKSQLDDFLEQTKYRKDNIRLYVGQQERGISNQVANVTKVANRYNSSELIGLNVNGIKITQISEHIIARTYARNLNFEDVKDALKNPLDFGKIRIDKEGRKSFKVIGQKVTIAVNPDTGKITTAHATHTKTAERLKEKKKNEIKK